MISPIPTRLGLTVDGKPAIARLLCGQVIVLWESHIAKRNATGLHENLALLAASFTTASLTAAGFTVT